MRYGVALGVAGVPLGDCGRLAAAAEAAGADVVCAGEVGQDSFVVAGQLAAATSTARVMTTVTTWARPPVSTAMAAMSVDELTGGRFVLGLGTMPPQWSLGHFGIPAEQPLARMREYVEVVRAAFGAHSGRRLVATGPRYPVDGWTRLGPPVRDRLPVHLAVTRPGMARLAGEVADGALVNVVVPPSWLRGRLLPALEEGAAARPDGGGPEIGTMVRVSLHGGAGERDGAYGRLRRSLSLYADVPYFSEIARASGADPTSLTDADLDLFGIVGTVEEAADALADLDPRLDWVELVPPSFLDGAALLEQYAALCELIGRVTATRR